MSRVYNFSAGPAALPLEVLEQIQNDLPDWQGTGMSVMEVSHRGKDFVEAGDARAISRDLPTRRVPGKRCSRLSGAFHASIVRDANTRTTPVRHDIYQSYPASLSTVGNRSAHVGLWASISSIFQARRHRFKRRSRLTAAAAH